MVTATARRTAWDVVAEVTDPELPVLTIEDLGVLRDVRIVADGDGAGGERVEVTITPTYSGCPAIDAIADDVTEALATAGYRNVRVKRVLSPAWTSDWMSEAGRAKLERFGIAPPSGMAAARTGVPGPVRVSLAVKCPHCSALNTRELSHFGATSCKALYECRDCLEPFDYFKVL